MKKILRILSLTVAFSAGVHTANAADAELIAAAQKEGVVSWYVSLIQNQAVRPLVAAFEKKYPNVKVEVVGGTVGDLLTKITAELDAGQLQADVHHGGSVVGRLMERGAVGTFPAEIATHIPEDLKDPENHWAAQVVSFLVPAYNTDMVSEADAPKTLDDLLDPRWKGKIAWTNSMSQGGPAGFIGTVLEIMGEEAGLEYLKKLSTQEIVNVPANQRVVLDHVIQGEYPIALQTFSHHSDISASKGAPVKWIAMKPAVSNTLDAAFLFKDAPHPHAATLLLDFLFSDEGQQALREANYIPANPALRSKETAIDSVAITPTKTAKSLKEWIAIYDELFK